MTGKMPIPVADACYTADQVRAAVIAMQEASLNEINRLARYGVPTKTAWNNLHGMRDANATDFMTAICALSVDQILEQVKK